RRRSRSGSPARSACRPARARRRARESGCLPRASIGAPARSRPASSRGRRRSAPRLAARERSPARRGRSRTTARARRARRRNLACTGRWPRHGPTRCRSESRRDPGARRPAARTEVYQPASRTEGPERSEGVGARAGAAEHDPSPTRWREESQRVGPKGPSEARVSERAQAQPSTIRVRLAGVKKASESDRRARATNSSLSAGAARACVVGDLAVLARAPTGVGVGWIVAVTAGQRADPGLELTDRLAEIAQIGALL